MSGSIPLSGERDSNERRPRPQAGLREVVVAAQAIGFECWGMDFGPFADSRREARR